METKPVYPEQQLEGNVIKEIFSHADALAEIHATLTSPRGNWFRLHLLQALRKSQTIEEIQAMRKEAQLEETQRHLHKLLDTGLIHREGNRQNDPYERTPQGEVAVNAVRAFERQAGEETARALYEAALGPNSIRLFLRVYGNDKPADFKTRDIVYTPEEIGKLCLFLPRSVEGVAAIEKLSDAGILVYDDKDERIHFQSRLARGFYQYLKDLYSEVLQKPQTQKE